MGGSERTPAATAKALGTELYANGDFAAAEDAYTEAITLAGAQDRPELHVYYSNRCAARQQLGNLDAAIEDAQKCTKLDASWAKGWSRLGTCLLQKGRNSAAVSAFAKASSIEPRNSTYSTQLKNAQARMQAPQGEASGRGAGRSAPPQPSGPGMGQRATTYMVQQLTSAINWWQNLSSDQQRLIGAGIVLGMVVVAYYIYDFFFGGYSYNYTYDDPFAFAYDGRWSWSFWLLVVAAAYKVPPRFGMQPFFGMSFVHFVWLLQMLQNNGGGGGRRMHNPGLFGRRRRW